MNRITAKILAIDDNPKNLDMLSELLNRKAFTLMFALDGLTGIQRAESGQPDLILLDVMMPPGIDGFETCRRLKANEKTKDIPVIFMTALADVNDKVTGFESGAVDYITKPIEPREALARINTHLTIQKLQTELRIKNAMLADREVHLTYLVKEQTKAIEAQARKIEHITMALVNALENANTLNDEDTGSHIKRVGEYSALLAEKYGCDAPFVNRIKLYASLHDVGKIGLPDTILKKAGIYTDEERFKMQQHVVFGARLLESEGVDEMARNIALYHHEKWDGTGYIQGLAGEAIPLEARIVALADVYDALISHRVYKEAFSEDLADSIIRENAGKHFEPHLVALFFRHKDELLQIRQFFT